MAQLNYNDMVAGQPGLKADSGFDNVLTYRAVADIAFGLGLMQGAQDNDAVLPGNNQAVLTFDGDFVALNLINADVNGEAINEVEFDTDQATTLAALAASISDMEDVSATVTGARQITIVYSGAGALTVENVVVTAGAGQAGVDSLVFSSSQNFVGVALRTHTIEQNLDGEAFYKAMRPVNVLTRGRVYVFAESALNVGDSLFVRAVAGGANELPGQFRNDNAGGNAVEVSGRVTMSAQAGGLAVIEVNLP